MNNGTVLEDYLPEKERQRRGLSLKRAVVHALEHYTPELIRALVRRSKLDALQKETSGRLLRRDLADHLPNGGADE